VDDTFEIEFVIRELFEEFEVVKERSGDILSNSVLDGPVPLRVYMRIGN